MEWRPWLCVLGLVDAASLGEDLGCDLVVGSGLLLRCGGGDLGPVDREDGAARKPRLGAEAEDLAEACSRDFRPSATRPHTH